MLAASNDCFARMGRLPIGSKLSARLQPISKAAKNEKATQEAPGLTESKSQGRGTQNQDLCVRGYVAAELICPLIREFVPLVWAVKT